MTRHAGALKADRTAVPAPDDAGAPASSASENSPDLIAFTQRLRRGDDAAWTQFFDLYHSRMRGFIMSRWTGDPSAVDDILQDTLMRAVRHMRDFDREDVFWCWLTALARSAVADHGRRETRRFQFLRRFRSSCASLLLHRQSDLPSHPREMKLPQALAKLDPESRALLEAKYRDSRSVRDLAASLSLTEKAVEGRLARARKRLRRQLARSTPPPS